MQKIYLGNTDLEVSTICFGTMYFGTKVDSRQSFELLDHYVSQGGNFLDTSNNYAFWMDNGTGDESENVLGQWFNRHGKRNEVVLATKVGARPKTPGAGAENLEGLSYQTIVQAVEASLHRLNTDYIDLYYDHVDWYDYPLEERLEAFTRLIKEGKVRALGASNMYAWRFEKSQQIAKDRGLATYCCLQQRYTYLPANPGADFWVQKEISEEWKDYAAHNQVQLIAYSPLLSGAYATGNLPDEFQSPQNKQKLKLLEQMATELKVTKSQLVLAWMLNASPRILPIIGASKKYQLDEAINASKIQLDQSQLLTLNQ